MKKTIKLTTLGVLLVTLLAGCSCSKNGEYEFEYVEYTEDNKTKRAECERYDGLPTSVVSACILSKAKEEYILADDKLYEEDSNRFVFFKIDGKKVFTKNSENDEYKESEVWSYKKGKLYYKYLDTYLVYEK